MVNLFRSWDSRTNRHTYCCMPEGRSLQQSTPRARWQELPGFGRDPRSLALGRPKKATPAVTSIAVWEDHLALLTGTVACYNTVVCHIPGAPSKRVTWGHVEGLYVVFQHCIILFDLNRQTYWTLSATNRHRGWVPTICPEWYTSRVFVSNQTLGIGYFWWC